MSSNRESSNNDHAGQNRPPWDLNYRDGEDDDSWEDNDDDYEEDPEDDEESDEDGDEGLGYPPWAFGTMEDMEGMSSDAVGAAMVSSLMGAFMSGDDPLPEGLFFAMQAAAMAHAEEEQGPPKVKCPLCLHVHEYQEPTGPSMSRFHLSHDARVSYVDNMTCPICLDVPSEPPMVTLACGHVVCRDDFEQLGGEIKAVEPGHSQNCRHRNHNHRHGEEDTSARNTPQWPPAPPARFGSSMFPWGAQAMEQQDSQDEHENDDEESQYAALQALMQHYADHHEGTTHRFRAQSSETHDDDDDDDDDDVSNCSGSDSDGTSSSMPALVHRRQVDESSASSYSSMPRLTTRHGTDDNEEESSHDSEDMPRPTENEARLRSLPAWLSFSRNVHPATEDNESHYSDEDELEDLPPLAIDDAEEATTASSNRPPTSRLDLRGNRANRKQGSRRER